MITIIENDYFIEAVLLNKKEVKQYLHHHPQKKKCKVLVLNFNTFPFFIIENGFGNFLYYSNKNKVIDYIKNVDLWKIKTATKASFKISANLETESEITTGLALTIYKLTEPYTSEFKNKDSMGLIDHYHIDQENIMEIKNGNIDNFNI